MSTYFLRNTTESPTLLKQFIGTVLPLSLKRHLLYLKQFRRIGNFRNPRLFSEKIQWRIINDRREKLRYTCDKRASKRMVANTATSFGVKVSIPREIAFSHNADSLLSALQQLQVEGVLPRQWVMKPNHSSGQVLAIDGAPDWMMIEEAARAWLKPSRFAGLHWIWPYVTAETGLLAEEFIPGDQPPLEWHLWVIGGLIEYTVVQQRVKDRRQRSVFDRNWAPVAPWYNREAQSLPIMVPPKQWENIERAALALGSEWDMIRVDLYEDRRGQLWFSELTPYPQEGLISNTESAFRFDEAAGAAWPLPALSKEERAGG